jgi:uncharacterized protein
MARKLYDCMKCPGYCCSYPAVQVKESDVKRIAKHFDMSIEAANKKFFKMDKNHGKIMRRQKDQHFGKICQFFDTDARRCTIYHARPYACRDFPGEGRCGYYDFLKFERDGQEDETYISTTNHA